MKEELDKGVSQRQALNLSEPKLSERQKLTRGQKDKLVQAKLKELFGEQATEAKKFYNKNSAPVDNFSFYTRDQTKEIYGLDEEGDKQRQAEQSQAFLETLSEQEKNKRNFFKLLDDIGIKKPSHQ